MMAVTHGSPLRTCPWPPLARSTPKADWRAMPPFGRLRAPPSHRAILDPAPARDAVIKLNPRHLMANPVILTTEVVALLATHLHHRRSGPRRCGAARMPRLFPLQIALWLWATVLFANLAESVAEGRGKAAADSAARQPASTPRPSCIVDPEDRDARRARPLPSKLERGRHRAGRGRRYDARRRRDHRGHGFSVNEAAITGESAPVIRESGGDRSAVTGGTTVVSDWLKVRVTAAQGSSFLDRMIAMVEGADRRKTPNEIALAVLLAGSDAGVPDRCGRDPGGAWPVLRASSARSPGAGRAVHLPYSDNDWWAPFGGRHRGHGPAVEVQCAGHLRPGGGSGGGRATRFLLDKTGTITFGNRMASEVIPAHAGRQSGRPPCARR